MRTTIRQKARDGQPPVGRKLSRRLPATDVLVPPAPATHPAKSRRVSGQPRPQKAWIKRILATGLAYLIAALGTHLTVGFVGGLLCEQKRAEVVRMQAALEAALAKNQELRTEVDTLTAAIRISQCATKQGMVLGHSIIVLDGPVKANEDDANLATPYAIVGGGGANGRT